MKEEFIQELDGLCSDAHIDLTSEQVDKMYAYYEFLVEENQKYNLTRITTPKEAARSHFFDSIVPCSQIAANASLLDVGSGAGFPAVPIKIARPDVDVTAMDATAKKCNFIEKACEAVDICVNVLLGRAEEIARTQRRESFDAVCARAVADLPVLIELTSPLVRVGGQLLYYKADYAEELKAAKHAVKALGLRLIAEVPVPSDAMKHFILVFTKERQTDNLYPRRYAQIKKRPL